MKRASPKTTPAAPQAKTGPMQRDPEVALHEAQALMLPVVRWLLRSGVSYPVFSDLLKFVFLKAAVDELSGAHAPPSQSALSLFSGLHRKDVRSILDAPESVKTSIKPTLSSQVFTRWITDRRFRLPDGKPRALPRTGGGRSFEALCLSLSNDVHPRAVLDELQRLGLVRIDDGDEVVVSADAFVPSARLNEITALFAANASDHLAAAVSNITQDGPKFLEQSIYADGLTAESIELLHQTARQAWALAHESIVARARERVDHDGDGELRMRFGVYFFSEPTVSPTSETPATPAVRKSIKPRQPAKTRRKT